MRYLLERNLITAQSVVDGGLKIVDMSRRNRVFAVTADGERAFVVKQSSDRGGGVGHEAVVLERLRATHARLAAQLPAVVSFDGATGVLVLEAAHDPQNLRDRHARGRFPRELAAQVGRTLALLHATQPEILDDRKSPLDPSWILQLHRPSLTDAHEVLAGAAIEFVKTIQRSEHVCAALDELHASWDARTVIHGDIRWDNLVTARTAGGSSCRSRLLLVDWESAECGDPSLDVGAFFGEYLYAWLRSIPIVDPTDPGRLVEHAGLPLARMRPALAAFWLSYAGHSSAAPRELARLLRRAASCAAVRVLACALESSMSSHALPRNARFALQFSENILRRPDEALAHLIGIGASWPSP